MEELTRGGGRLFVPIQNKVRPDPFQNRANGASDNNFKNVQNALVSW